MSMKIVARCLLSILCIAFCASATGCGGAPKPTDEPIFDESSGDSGAPKDKKGNDVPAKELKGRPNPIGNTH